MKKINILVVDDEPPARKKIITFLEEEQDIGSIWEAGNGVEAVTAIKEREPDLVFLDIQMPGMTGFEVIEAIGVHHMPAVIFVTAYDNYAIEAFEVEAVDYLLKPFHIERFSRAFKRVSERLNTGNAEEVGESGENEPGTSENARVIRRLLQAVNNGKPALKRLMVKTGPRFFFVNTSDIMYISAEEKYVRLHTAAGTHLLRQGISALEKRLDPEGFVRIHRSHIVNVDYISEIQPWTHGDYVVILKKQTRLTMSRRYRERLLALFT